MEKYKIQRISELTHISKDRELTPKEQREREVLRKEYINDFRNATIATLENTYLITPDGKKHKLPKKGS